MNDKKIVIVTRNMSSGGAERVIAQLLNYFTNKKYDCTLITILEDEIYYTLDDKIKIIEIGNKSNNRFINKLRIYTQLRKIIKNINPNVVLSLPEEIGIYVILSLLNTSIPVIVSERNNPWIMPDNIITRSLRPISYYFADKIIFQTEMAKSFFPNYVRSKSVVLSNPVEPDRLPLRYCGDRDKRIVSIGRLEAQKNFKYLIMSFYEFQKEFSDYTLEIYGEGRDRIELEELIDGLNLNGKVKMPGRDKNVLEKIKTAAMFILPSNYEGLPNALIEAMCIGMPVISTNCPSGGPKTLIQNGKNGLLIPINDKIQMVNAMKKMTDTNFANTLAKEAYKTKDVLTDISIFEKWEKELEINRRY